MSTKSSLPDLRLGWLATSALMAALAAPLAARAQAAPDQPATVGEVIVTAQKRSESVKEVPNAVAVVSTQTLVDSGITEVRDLNGLVPGLQVTGGLGSGEVVIRGVTAGNDVGGTTAVVIDGVVVGPEDETAGGDNYIPQFDPSMISRLEVLKGPQGTLYGGSTLGGLLIYDTKKPTLTKPYGGFYVEGSETEHGGGNYILRGNVSAPIIQDKLGFSLSANDQDLTGYIKDPERGDKGYDSHRNIGVRGALLWQVSPDFQVQVSDLYTRQRSFTDQIIVTPTTPVSSLTYNSGILPSYNNEYNLAAINATYDLHWATLTYTGAYQTGTGSIALSYANTPTQAIYQFYLPLFGGTVLTADAELGVPEISSFDKYSSELRLSSPDTGKFRWIAGVYYVNETDKLYEDLGDFNLATQTNAAGPAGSLAIFELQSKLQQVAEYGDVTYYILPDLDVTGGIRISEYQQSYSQFSGGSDHDAYNILGSLFGYTPTPALTPVNKSNTTVETYQANVRYHISPNDMVYFRYATGYRPGGPNDSIPGVPAIYGPDTTDNYEVGWKANLWNNKAYLEVAGYDIEWRDIQVEAIKNGLGYLANGGAAQIKGAEVALTLRPIRGLNLNGSFAYTDGKLTQTTAGGVGAAGDPMPNTPKFSGSLSGEYTQPLGDGWDGFVGANARYVDVRESAFLHSQTYGVLALHPYTIVDLRAGLIHGPYEITAFVRNVGDDRAVLGGEVYGETLLSIARPRTYGLSLTAHY